MGGNALKNCTTRRYAAEEYQQIAFIVQSHLHDMFPNVQTSVIKSYRNKETFGDLDILVESNYLPANWIERVTDCFRPKEHVKNGNVLSFEYQEFQIDLIATPAEHFDTSVNYFAYNDLGNLLGRVAQSIGLKLGHTGLSYKWYDDTHVYGEEILLTDWEEILSVLGYSYERYQKGFDTLEDIFEFVVSSFLFKKSIYALENRNNYARTRDKKRPTYTAFLEYIEGVQETDLQLLSRDSQKDGWLPYIRYRIPHFAKLDENVRAEYQKQKDYKSKFNGDLVKQWTGLEGKELGSFMMFLRGRPESSAVNREFVLGVTLEDVQRDVMYNFSRWSNKFQEG